MIASDYEKTLLALALWREDRGAGLDGMTAVGHCLSNRVKEWKKTWTQVLTEKNQLSSMSYLGDSQTIVFPDPRDPAFVQLMQSIDAIYDGSGNDTSNGALYYANTKNITPTCWFSTHIVNDPTHHPLCATLGGHKFFR